jgi:hypothetical protein
VPPPAVMDTDAPLHIVGGELAVMVGSGFIVTVTLFVFVQPLASVPVTVYVVVVVGLAETIVPVVGDNPVEGDHMYEDPPVAVSDVDCPIQRKGAVGFIDMVGFGLTVTVTDALLVHPIPSVPVTVYIVVEVGFAVTFAPVVGDNPAEGLHE